MATKSIFHPYKILEQTDTTLQLGTRSNTTMWMMRLLPLLFPAIFTYALLTDDRPAKSEVFYFGIGLTFFMVFFVSLFKSPAALKMDSLGMKVTYVSFWGHKDKYVLWSDVERLEYFYRRGKGGGYYVYRAITNDSKKIRFLHFSGYQLKEKNIPDVNATLERVSGKSVVRK